MTTNGKTGCTDLGPIYLVLEYIFEVLVFMIIMGHVLVLVLMRNLLRFYEYIRVLLKYDAMIIIYDLF